MSVFLILGIAGVMVLLVSLILGDLLDSALHFDGLDSDGFLHLGHRCFRRGLRVRRGGRS